MEIKIIMLVNLFVYSIIVSQPFSYLLALRNVQENLQPAAYIQVRKLTDKNYDSKFRYIFYFSLLSCGVLTLLSSMHLSGMLFITSATALAAMLLDVVLIIKGNIPLNKMINTWTEESYPANWKYYRRRWFRFFSVRQVLNIIAFISLALGAVFAS